MWKGGVSLKYNTVFQLDWFWRKQGKWVEVVYVLPFFSLQNMPDLCPKGIDLSVKPSGPSCPTLPLYPGLQTEQTGNQRPPIPQEGLLCLSRNSN